MEVRSKPTVANLEFVNSCATKANTDSALVSADFDGIVQFAKLERFLFTGSIYSK